MIADLRDMMLFNQRFHLHSRGWRQRGDAFISPYTGNVMDQESAIDVEYNLTGINRAIQCVTKLKPR